MKTKRNLMRGWILVMGWLWMTGFALGQFIQINPPSPIDFGDQMVNVSSTPVTVTISNAGQGDIVVNSIASGNSVFGIGPIKLPAPLPPFQTLHFILVFAPSTLGVATGTITIGSTDPASPTLIQLTGRGVAPIINVTPASLIFGSVLVGTASTTQTVTIQNAGTALLIVSSVTSSQPVFTLGTIPTTVAPGSSASFPVSFTPTAVGPASGTITINSNALGVPTIRVSVTGVGILQKIAVTPVSLTFGQVPVGTTSSSQNITVQNIGTVPLNVTGATSTNSAFLINNNPVTTLAPGTSATLSVSFQPSVAGPANGMINIASNDPVNPTVRVSTNGSGFSPGVNTVVTVVNPSLSGNVAGHQATANVLLGNLAAPLAVDFPLGLSLQFTPLVPGGQDGTIRFNPPVPANYGIPAGQLASPPASFFAGTLAGTITITAINGLGATLGHATLVIPPTPPVVTQLAAAITSNSIQLNVTGFDPTRGVSQATFTFFGPDGSVINPGPLIVPVAAPFSGYFSSPAAQAVGSMFLMTASFTVTGSIADIASTQLVLSNSLGSSVPRTIRFADGPQTFPIPKRAEKEPTNIAVLTQESKSHNADATDAAQVMPPLLGVTFGVTLGELKLVEGIGEVGVIHDAMSFEGEASFVRNSPAGDTALVADSIHNTLTLVGGIATNQLSATQHANYENVSLIRYSRNGSRAVLASSTVPMLRTVQITNTQMAAGKSFRLPEVRPGMSVADVAITNDGSFVVMVFSSKPDRRLGGVLVLKAGTDERAAIRYWFDRPDAVAISFDGTQLFVADNGRRKLYRVSDFLNSTGVVEEVFDYGAAGIAAVTDIALNASDTVAALVTDGVLNVALLKTDALMPWALVGMAAAGFTLDHAEFLKDGALLLQNTPGRQNQVIAPSFVIHTP